MGTSNSWICYFVVVVDIVAVCKGFWWELHIHGHVIYAVVAVDVVAVCKGSWWELPLHGFVILLLLLRSARRSWWDLPIHGFVIFVVAVVVAVCKGSRWEIPLWICYFHCCCCSRSRVKVVSQSSESCQSERLWIQILDPK